MKHIVCAQEFDRKFLDQFLLDAAAMKEYWNNPIWRLNIQEWLPGQNVCSFFYEESTRTRISFETAAQNMGMRLVSTTNAGAFSSAKKGETLSDTIQTLMGYAPRVIVLRHNEEGSARTAAELVDACGKEVSIINAGDGQGQHPTQALLDLFTIQSELGRVEGITVAVGGDLLHGRTTHSLVYLLAKYPNIRFIFISPNELKMKEGIVEHLTQSGIPHRETEDKGVIADADVVYWTRTQRERMDEELFARVNGRYSITASDVAGMKRGAVILHPLPRLDEISRELDRDPRAKYFVQAENGLYVRMALMARLCGVSVR